MSSLLSAISRTIQRHQNLLITLGLVLVALPFVALSFYNHPALDDFLDAVVVKQQGFWAAQKYFYLNHTGRYTTTVLLASVNPLIYGHLEGNWWPVALGFMLGTLLVLRLVAGLLPGISGWAAWRGAGVVSALWLAFAPGQAEGLYWFTGAYTYLATAWLLLLWLAALLKYVAARRDNGRHGAWLLALIILTTAVAGTTEPAALPFLVLLLVGALLVWRFDQYRWVAVLLAGLALAGSVVSFTASGNFVRMHNMDQSFGIVKALLYSGVTTAYLLLTWVGNPVLLLVSALLLPALCRVAQHRDGLVVRVLARIPAGILAGGMVLLLAAASCPAYYASGTGLPLRTRNTLYLLFLVGWFMVLLTWCCRQASRKQPAVLTTVVASSRWQPLWVGLLLLFFFADYNVQTRRHLLGNSSNNAIRAYQQWLGGDASRYDAELRRRYQLLATKRPVVRLPPLQTQPELLFCFDIVGVESPFMLRQYADYFGVPQVDASLPARAAQQP